MELNEFEKAILFAVNAHAGSQRKGEPKPYILHPLEVAAIAGTMSRDLELLSAAVLHDVVEDTGYTAEDIENNFSAGTAALVRSETENKRPGIPAGETWKIRKEESLRKLAESTDIRVKMLWLADKLSNIRSFADLKEKKGDDLWDSFNQKDPSLQKWYYTTVAELTKELSGYAAYKEFTELINILFEGV